MNVILRPMEEQDVDGVVKISDLSFPSPWSKTSYLQEIRNPVSKYIVAVLDNKIVGFVGTWIVLDESHITNVAVHPDFRKLNIGSLLINSLINICKCEYNCKYLDLEVRRSNIPAQKLYFKYGFKEIGIRKGYYSDNKEDALLLKLECI